MARAASPNAVLVKEEAWPRIILHADMDAFFAAIEQLDDPALRGQPLLIGHPGARGVVATASYEARPYGVGSAMPMATARRLCPEAIVRAPRMARYQEISAIVMHTFETFSPCVEALSLDEAFLDMSGSRRLFGPPAEMARKLKREIFKRTGGLRVSVGVATNKYVAKVASDYDKPDGLTLVIEPEKRHFLSPLPLSCLWGVGPVTKQRLEGIGLQCIGDLQGADPEWLQATLGSLGPQLYALARGEDDRDVVSDRDAKSIGAEATLDRDVQGRDEIRPHLLRAAERVARRLRRARRVAFGVRVKLKTRRFALASRQLKLRVGIDDADRLFETALGLLEHFDLRQPMRLVGLTAFDLGLAKDAEQEDLFGAPKRRRRKSLDRALDRIEGKFGKGAVVRASLSKGPGTHTKANASKASSKASLEEER